MRLSQFGHPRGAAPPRQRVQQAAARPVRQGGKTSSSPAKARKWFPFMAAMMRPPCRPILCGSVGC